MSKVIRIFTLSHLALGLCLAAGCGGADNTVELPTNPAPPPKTGPVGTDSGGTEDPSNTADPNAGTTALSAPPAVNP